MANFKILNQIQSFLKKVREEETDEIRIAYLEDALNHVSSFINTLEDDEFRGIFEDIPYRILSHFLVYSAKTDEVRYAVRKLKEWNKAGLLKDARNLITLSLPNLSEAEVDGIQASILYAKIVVNTTYETYHLSDFFVRRELWETIRNGNQINTLTLARYYFDKKAYRPAFMLLALIADTRLQTEKAEMLGLMYFYGRGVNKDFARARCYFESYIDGSIAPKTEVIYALGVIYSTTVGVRTAMKFYQDNILDDPSCIDNPYYVKIVEDFIVNRRLTTPAYDEIHLKVKITPHNRKCEFSVKIMAHCEAIVNWHDTSLKDKGTKLTTAGHESEDRQYVFKHKYKKAGVYEIVISFIPGGVDVLDFSKYKNQLIDISFGRCKGFKQISLIGQSLTELKLPYSPCLCGLILRNNNLQYLDISKVPRLNWLDCSYNPIEKVSGQTKTSLKHICIRGTNLDRYGIQQVLKLNDGNFCNPLYSTDIKKEDMKLEHYFRLTTWDKIKKFLKTNLSEYYWHYLCQCEQAFKTLKIVAKNNNHTPYDQGYLSVDNEYVSDDTIIHEEEIFLEKQPWTVSLATKVREWRRREPWMQYEPVTAEYFVACCLVNMIDNKSEMRKYKN